MLTSGYTDARRTNRPGKDNDPPGRYRHYNGSDCEVTGIARHSETEEELVVYRKLYGDGSLWVRPLTMFLEHVLVDGRQVPRVAWVE